MFQFSVDPNARHPLYPRAMPLAKVAPGVQLVTLDTHKGNLALTILASEWRAEAVSIVTSNGFPLRSFYRLRAEDVNSDTIDLCNRGIHPPVEAAELWDLGHLSVEATRDDILAFYPWLVKEGFLRAASTIEDIFFDYFVDASTYWDQLLHQTDA